MVLSDAVNYAKVGFRLSELHVDLHLERERKVSFFGVKQCEKNVLRRRDIIIKVTPG